MLNPAARSVAGVGFSARLAVLHSAAGTITAHNLYVQSCARHIEAAIRAYNSSLSALTERWRGSVFSLHHWRQARTTFSPTPALPSRFYGARRPDSPLSENRVVNLLHQRPVLKRSYSVSSTYYSAASEFETDVRPRGQMYDFRGVGSWRDVALQAVLRVDWRPDCAVAVHSNSAKTLPPADPHRHLIFGSWGQMPDFWGFGEAGFTDWSQQKSGGLHIAAGAFFQRTLGLSIAYMLDPDE